MLGLPALQRDWPPWDVEGSNGDDWLHMCLYTLFRTIWCFDVFACVGSVFARLCLRCVCKTALNMPLSPLPTSKEVSWWYPIHHFLWHDWNHRTSLFETDDPCSSLDDSKGTLISSWNSSRIDATAVYMSCIAIDLWIVTRHRSEGL